MDPQPSPRSAPAASGEPLPEADAGRQPASAPFPAPHQVARTRAGSYYAAAIAFAVLLLLLLIFILQNGRSVRVSFLGFDGHLPLAVAMLLAAVIGALLVGLLGLARVIQLRHTAKRHQKQDLRR
jgi:putative membrane protein